MTATKRSRKPLPKESDARVEQPGEETPQPKAKVSHFQLPLKDVSRISRAWEAGGKNNPTPFFENVLNEYPRLRTLDNVKVRLEKLGLITLPPKKYVLTESDAAFAFELAESVAATVGHTTSSSPRSRKLLRQVAVELLNLRKHKHEENTDETPAEEEDAVLDAAATTIEQIAVNPENLPDENEL